MGDVIALDLESNHLILSYIDYRICCGGKNTALNISVERLKQAKDKE